MPAASQRQAVLWSLAAYYVVGSLVDLMAFNDSIVGPASVPSAVIRIAVGVGGQSEGSLGIAVALAATAEILSRTIAPAVAIRTTMASPPSRR